MTWTTEKPTIPGRYIKRQTYRGDADEKKVTGQTVTEVEVREILGAIYYASPGVNCWQAVEFMDDVEWFQVIHPAAAITEEYARILAALSPKPGEALSYCGEPVDLTNPTHALVIGYTMGVMDAAKAGLEKERPERSPIGRRPKV